MIMVGSWGFIAMLLVVLIRVVPRGNPAADSTISMSAMVVNILIAFGPMQKIVSFLCVGLANHEPHRHTHGKLMIMRYFLYFTTFV